MELHSIWAELLVHQLLILNPMRLLRIFSKSTLPIRLVVRVIPLEPNHVAIAFERENMRGDAIEEPAIMRDHDSAAAEI